MNEAVIHLHPAGRLAALVGNPNAGKTALFNRLTGSSQKVANYAGVTVERKEGKLSLATGKTVRILDLPGTYSLHPRSPDERITCEVLLGRATGEKRPDLVVCVVDATNLRRGLRLVLGVKRMGLPCVVALNMADLAASRGIMIDADALARELGVPVVRTVAIEGEGDAALRALLDRPEAWAQPAGAAVLPPQESELPDHEAVRALLRRLNLDHAAPHLPSDRIDRVVLHPVVGPLLLAVLLFFVFQAVFAWATLPMDAIKEATAWLGRQVSGLVPPGRLQSFLVDGLVAGVGGVIVFLPQILILFFFILVLEESGYLPRAAFLLDRLMGGVGLSGRSFIPLLSSFACAIPGIMAARTIANPRDRLVTIMIAPMMTCSARLPVYALLIGAFIPSREVGPGFELQGLVLFGLYVAGVTGSLLVAWVLKRFTSQGHARPLMMELPSYHLPRARNVLLGLWQRAQIFMRRVGGIILVLTIALWFLASFPSPPEGATQPAIEYSIAGILGKGLAVILGPIGFNWQISIALVPGMAAREVAVGALGTVYALSATGADTAQALTPLIAHSWSLATALSLLAWFVFAPQCLSTLATVKRETGGWRWPLVMAGYLFALAYVASFVTYRVAVAMGAG
ncbi:MAG: ferrous iron transporter B [Burkholderiales bacterium]|nr:ferrous iron transporter B [Burkholderiales bacterium]